MVNAALQGLSCPVYCSPYIDWSRDYSGWTVRDLLAQNDFELAAVDPLAMNLIVAREIPQLADLDIRPYQQQVNGWADDFRSRWLPEKEPFFHEAPQDFRNDLTFFRLGMLCQYVDMELGVRYKAEHRERQTRGDKIQFYTDPADLFLHGVIGSREGTCANMATLQLSLGWRLGWPVSLATVASHKILRFDDGRRTYNIETTDLGRGGWSSRPDAEYVAEYGIPRKAIECGSDLRALRCGEVLALFLALRARYYQDCARVWRRFELFSQAETDWLLARHLCPTNRLLYKNAMGVSALRGEDFFDAGEVGHPCSLADWLRRIYGPRDDVTDALLTASITQVSVSPDWTFCP